MKRFHCILCALALCATSTFAATLADTEAEIRAAWDKVASLRAKIAVDAAIPVGENRMRLDGEGTLLYLKAGDTGKYRQDVVIQIPEPQALEMVSTMLFDGKDLHMRSTVAGQTTNVKTDAGVDPFSPPPGGGPLLDAIKSVATLALEPATTHAGRPAHVLTATPLEGASEADAFSRIVLTIDVETGARLKAEYYERDNVLTVSAVLSDLEINPELDAAKFETASLDAPATPPAEAATPAVPAP